MSAIAKNASITLMTGVPGNGKTLRLVWYIAQALAAGEQVFVSNLNGLQTEGHIDFPDPTKWEELPAGCILAVDEAQKFFRASGGTAPSYIHAMEEIRHRGIRLILITQHPALIHANIRALVGLHEHLVRVEGKPSATVYRRSRVIDNVRSDKALATEDHETWAFPVKCYDLYKSAEVHTVTRTVNSRFKRGMILLAIALAIIAVLAWRIGSRTLGDDEATPSGTVTSGAVQGGGASSSDEPRWPTVASYAQDHLPRIGSMPWTAPVFDGRTVTADPQLICMSSPGGLDAQGDFKDASCTCLTEQGTAYDLSQPECRTLARRGPVYNPYRERNQQGAGAPVPAQAPLQQVQSSQPAVGQVSYQSGNRADPFPRSPGYQASGYTGPTTTL